MIGDPVLTACLAFLLGATLGPDWPILPSTLCIALGVCLLTWTKWLRTVLPAASAGASCAIGLALSGWSVPPPLDAPAEAAIQGEVTDVTTQANQVRVVVHAPAPPWPEDVVVFLPYGSDVEVGDERSFTGEVLPLDDRGRVLGATAQGVRLTMVRATAGPARASKSLPLVLRVRRWIIKRQARAHPGDAGALLTGLLVGGRSTMTSSAQRSLRTAGLAHIVAISGANFALVLDALRRATSKLPRRIGVVVLAGGAVCFWLFVGGGMAVARAAVMSLAALVAEQLGRRSGGVRALMLCAVGLTLVSPLAPRADASFQLSILATMAVLLTGMLMRNRAPGLLEWRVTLATTLVTTAYTLPVHLVSFGTIQLWAPVANVLVLPLVPITMAAGALEFLLSWIPILGDVLEALTSLLLGSIIAVARGTSMLPGASTELPTLPAWSHGLILAGGGALGTWFLLRAATQRAVDFLEPGAVCVKTP